MCGRMTAGDDSSVDRRRLSQDERSAMRCLPDLRLNDGIDFDNPVEHDTASMSGSALAAALRAFSRRGHPAETRMAGCG